MKSIYIQSENPEHHWNYLSVDNQIVLDLGCGKHLVEDNWLTTPEFFLSKGADIVIGVDPHGDDIEWYCKNIERPIDTQSKGQTIFFEDYIDSVEKIERYINYFKVTSLKMDIEWNEKHFINSDNQFPTLKYIAVETHSRELFHDMLFKLLSLNFTITHVGMFYPRVRDICNIIYAQRN